MEEPRHSLFNGCGRTASLFAHPRACEMHTGSVVQHWSEEPLQCVLYQDCLKSMKEAWTLMDGRTATIRAPSRVRECACRERWSSVDGRTTTLRALPSAREKHTRSIGQQWMEESFRSVLILERVKRVQELLGTACRSYSLKC